MRDKIYVLTPMLAIDDACKYAALVGVLICNCAPDHSCMRNPVQAGVNLLSMFHQLLEATAARSIQQSKQEATCTTNFTTQG